MQDGNETIAAGKCGDNLTWTYDEKQKLLEIAGSGPMEFEAIPWEEWKDELEVVFLQECSSICAGAFQGFRKLREVIVFEEELKEIGPSAFEDCVSLKSVEFFSCETELHKVGDCAFRNCTSLKNIEASAKIVGNRAFENCTDLEPSFLLGTQAIGGYAFANCKRLSGLPMYDNQGWFDPWCLEHQPGSGLIQIPEGAFFGCEGLRQVNIPWLIREVGADAFAGCKNLAGILVTKKTRYHASSFPVEPQLLEGFASCGNDWRIGGEICWTLRDGVLRFSGKGVVAASPEDWDLDYCNESPWDSNAAHTVIIEEGCEYINHCTFHNHRKLKNVVIPSTVKKIGNYAFAWCTGLESLVIPDSVEYIGVGAFVGVAHILYHGAAKDENWRHLRRN